MDFGLEGQRHAAVDAAEAPEVLILQPAAGAALEHPGRQAVLSGVEEGGHVEAVGGEAVLGIAHEAAVHVHGHSGFHRAEGQHHPAAGKVSGAHLKGAHGGHRGVVGIGHLGLHQGLQAVPGVLGIHIVGGIPLGVLQLEFSGNGDGAQRAVQAVAGQQRFGGVLRAQGEVGFPHAVQAHHQGGSLRVGLLHRAVDRMVGHGGQAIDGKDRRVG